MDIIDATIEYAQDRVGRGRAPRINVTQYVDDSEFVDSWVSARVVCDGLNFLKAATWYTKGRLDSIPRGLIVSASLQRQSETAALVIEGLLVRVRIDSDDELFVSVYSSEFVPVDFEGVLERLRQWLPHRDPPRPESVDVGFRYSGGRNARRNYTRSIDAPEWEEIRGNYPDAVREAAERLVRDFQAPAGGRLILLHGPPGTGKTYVIRALARAWRDWCRIEYVVDPEAFFGDADYMMHVLIKGDDDRSEREEEKEWRLLVIEDAGELLARDAKVRQGQGLARLLNMSEGLIGQGLRVMALISTNDDLGKLNEAVSRPGRTAAIVEFTSLSVDESNRWLTEHDVKERTVTRPMTLAELFAMVAGAGHQTQKKERPIGFLREQ